MNYYSIHRDTLNWVNELRSGMGYPKLKDFPKGVQTSPSGCVISNCFVDMNVGMATVGVERISLIDCSKREGKEEVIPELRLPAVVSEFIRKFDSGYYSQYVVEWEDIIDGVDLTPLYDHRSPTVTYADEVMTLKEKYQMHILTQRAEKRIHLEETARAQEFDGEMVFIEMPQENINVAA